MPEHIPARDIPPGYMVFLSEEDNSMYFKRAPNEWVGPIEGIVLSDDLMDPYLPGIGSAPLIVE